MANLDEDIKRITEEVLSDGTVDDIIRKNITKGMEQAIESSFSYGELGKVLKKRLEHVLVPFIEKYDMDAYIVKLDDVLTEIIKNTALTDNKKLLSNFQNLMIEPTENEIKVSEIFNQYKHHVEKCMDTYGREIDDDFSEGPEYVPMDVLFEVIKEEDKSWSYYEYLTVDFTVRDEEQEDTLNRTLRLKREKKSKREGYEITGTDYVADLRSLRYIDDFDLLIMKLQRAGARVIIDKTSDNDFVYSDTKPEATYE